MIRILQRWLVSMTLPFVVRTILIYGLGLDVPELAWLWKEIVIGVLLVVSLWSLVFGSGVKDLNSWQDLLKDKFLVRMVGLLLVLLVWSAILAFGVHDQSLREWIVFVKYDIFPWVVLLTGYLVAHLWGGYKRLAKTMQTIISVLLVVGVARRAVSVWIPDVLVWLGYSMDAYQWTESAAPPVRYLTQVWRGYIRNGSIFGGPTSRGFFLVAFAPWYIWRTWKDMEGCGRIGKLFWIVLLVVNVGLTFSRAAWGAFAVELLLILIVHFLAGSKKRTKKNQAKTAHMLFSRSASGAKLSSILRTSFLLCGAGILGVCATIGLIQLAGPVDVPQAAERDQGVFSRDLSDKGHLELLIEGIEKVGQSPRVGYGVASVGPGAYRIEEATSIQDYEDTSVYHPENQYIQLLMEVGVFGFVVWVGLRGAVVVSLWSVVSGGESIAPNSDGISLLFGVVGLGIVGLVLHSMMESMSIYPWMLMMGVWLGSHLREKSR